MIISRTPFRVSFFGGGTDYPSWYARHGGSILGATIDKYCYLTCRYLPPFFEHRMQVVWSRIERCDEIDEIEHPAVREILRYLKIERGMEIHHVGDLPARSGMGSSSTFTVGLLHALHGLCGRMPSKYDLAREAIHVEQEILKETVGSQDQVLAAYGGFNHVDFLPNGEISVRPVTVPEARIEELTSHLMLCYTGIKRTASIVADSYVQEIHDKHRQLRIMKDMVDEALSILVGQDDLAAFGELLHESWQIKRSLSAAITNPEVDDLYDRARRAGVIGGKLTGAGGGGFLLLFCPPDRQARLRQELDGLIHVPFTFSYVGSQILFYDPEADYSQAEQDRGRSPILPFHEATAQSSSP
ncbi:MAG: GHMP kinase [Planctomycetaceae bacterium]